MDLKSIGCLYNLLMEGNSLLFCPLFDRGGHWPEEKQWIFFCFTSPSLSLGIVFQPVNQSIKLTLTRITHICNRKFEKLLYDLSIQPSCLL